MRFKKPISRIRPVCLAMLLGLVSLAGCYREPYLHLPGEYRDFDIPLVDLNLVAYWNYKVTYSVEYDWKAEWYYGYSFEDSLLLGKIGYTKPKGYNVRRYFTYQQQYGLGFLHGRRLFLCLCYMFLFDTKIKDFCRQTKQLFIL